MAILITRCQKWISPDGKWSQKWHYSYQFYGSSANISIKTSSNFQDFIELKTLKSDFFDIGAWKLKAWSKQFGLFTDNNSTTGCYGNLLISPKLGIYNYSCCSNYFWFEWLGNNLGLNSTFKPNRYDLKMFNILQGFCSCSLGSSPIILLISLIRKFCIRWAKIICTFCA